VLSEEEGRKPYEQIPLGWFPHPKSGRPLFYNELLPSYYEAVYKFKSNASTFKKSFYKEAERQWNITSKVKELEKAFSFISGTNPASLGHFQETEVKLKIGDDNILQMNNVKLEKCLEKLDEIKKDVNMNQTDLHDESGRTLKRGYKHLNRDFNKAILSKCDTLLANVTKLKEKTENMLITYNKMFPNKIKIGRSEEGAVRKKKSRNKRKAQKRKTHRYKNKIRALMSSLVPEGNLIFTSEREDHISDIKAKINFGVFEVSDVRLDAIMKIQCYDVPALFLLMETLHVFSHQAKVLILENLQNRVENDYWKYFDEFYKSSSDSQSDNQSDNQEGSSSFSQEESDF